ncbi:type II secretion system minor pseudopilin GspH [Pleionea litopenaei]|uniref:Type II secretion system protein H n=1 Tax=Pleionea litopenaei TaxID=3070815 RepID=A0AA51RQR5_9GAMM|nr:type II secretion system minor pseudopilin GspH [Pleionea sp. HL-JVS1]WMS85799.1 type II secretion system minor pseudopilin GspH [Pleionea sp. HL-JVS1]
MTKSNKIMKINARLDSRGFSLLEILIALVIAGVLVSVAALSFGDDRKSELETNAKRFYALVKQAQDETLLRGIDIGIRVEEQKYWFYLFDPENEKWLPIEDDEFFTEKEIPETLEVKLLVDGSTLFSEDEDDVDIFEKDVNIFEEEDEKPIEPPQIFILSSGEMNDFKFAIGWVDDDPQYYLVTGTMLGEVQLSDAMSGNLREEVKEDDFLNL